MGIKEPSNSSRLRQEIANRDLVSKKKRLNKVLVDTAGENETKSVLSRMTAGAVTGFNFANSGEIRCQKKTASVAAKVRKDIGKEMGKSKFFSRNVEDTMLC